MIDTHAHILPSLDDGPQTIEESVELCKIAANDGIKKIVATPHSKDGVYEAKSDEILKMVDALNLKLKENQIDIEILPGAEIHIHEGLVESVKSGEVLTINNGGKFILLNFPLSSYLPGPINSYSISRSMVLFQSLHTQKEYQHFRKIRNLWVNWSILAPVSR